MCFQGSAEPLLIIIILCILDIYMPEYCIHMYIYIYIYIYIYNVCVSSNLTS